MCLRFLIISSVCFSLFLSGCISSPRKQWTIAVPAHNSKYEHSATLLQQVFEKEGLSLEVLPVSSTVDAGIKVSEGEADLMLALSHSDFLIPHLHKHAGNLRTVMPLFDNAMFLLYRTGEHPHSIIELTEHSKIFLEVLDSLSEQRLGLEKVFGMLNVEGYSYVDDTTSATVMPVWGTFTGDVARQMVSKKWQLYSMEEAFMNYALIIEPRFERLLIPGRYSTGRIESVNTLKSTAFLVGGKQLDRTELFDLIGMLYSNRTFFTARDKSYAAIRESFNTTDLHFPLHDAAFAYLRRDEPTFLERHAEYFGLIISILIIAFGAVQSIRNYIARKKKDRIDQYFLDYLVIKKDRTLDSVVALEKLTALHEKAVNQMIKEKLDITDFDIFSQTIRSDLVRLQTKTEPATGVM